jgi:hypothetical protein
MLVRFAYLAVTHAFAALRLLPMTDREKDVEILALRTNSPSCNDKPATNDHDFDPKTKHFSRRCSCRCPARLCVDSDCWSAQTQYCGGIATW